MTKGGNRRYCLSQYRSRFFGGDVQPVRLLDMPDTKYTRRNRLRNLVRWFINRTTRGPLLHQVRMELPTLV
jgi:hypothetical protein